MQTQSMILRWTLVFVLALGQSLFANPKCLAEPGPGIKQLMQTPASAFDLFLHALYINLNGVSYINSRYSKDTLWCNGFRYDPEENVLSIIMIVSTRHELLADWETLTDAQKQVLMLAVARATAETIGIEMRKGGSFSGCIQDTRCNAGAAEDSPEEAGMKDELRRRVSMTVSLPEVDRFDYRRVDRHAHIVTRTLDGRYLYERR